MKKIIYGLMLCLTTALFAGCEDETTQDTSVITYYITMEMNGEDFMIVPLGTPFTDPGVVAMEGEEDVTSKVVVDNPVDVNKAGFYTVSYSAINKDGFPSSITRTVAVCDPSITTDLSGTYTVAEGSYRHYFPDTMTPFSGYSVTISQLLPGMFTISDFLGGYYDVRAAYGPDYAMSGNFQLLPDNTIQALSGGVPGWGDSYDYLEEGVYDPETQTISFVLGYAQSMDFYITLTK